MARTSLPIFEFLFLLDFFLFRFLESWSANISLVASRMVFNESSTFCSALFFLSGITEILFNVLENVTVFSWSSSGVNSLIILFDMSFLLRGASSIGENSLTIFFGLDFLMRCESSSGVNSLMYVFDLGFRVGGGDGSLAWEGDGDFIVLKARFKRKISGETDTDLLLFGFRFFL